MTSNDHAESDASKQQDQQPKSGVVRVKSGGSPDKFWNPRFWDGMTICAWLKMLCAARRMVSPSRIPMFLTVSALTLLNSALAFFQRVFYGGKIRRTTIKRAPIFIVGHWRSGTTLLHEYFMRDDQFASPNTYECFAPTHFLVSEKIIRPWLNYLMPKKRPMDNMAAGLDRPQEDEFAICALGVNSPYRNVAFPNGAPIDPEYLTLREVSDDDRKRWLDALEYVVKTQTVAKDRVVLLKSPPHTARVKTILERFPNAKFVHISRDPFTLFPSTVNLWMKLSGTHGLQVPKGGPALEEKVLSDFEKMYDAFFEDIELLNDDAYCEISYDELVANPVATLEKIYAQLKIDGFSENRAKFEAFAETQKKYKKNQFELSPEMTETIARRWKKYIDRYGAKK